jgi:hypothetical protein
MKFIELIMALVYRFAPIKDDEFSKLNAELTEDWAAVITDPEHEHYKPGIKATIKRFTSGAWARLFMGVAFIVLVRVIQDWMSPKEDQQNDNNQSIF